MSTDNHWMPFYVGDYLADTMHLTTAEHGAYLLLLMHQWRTGSVPDDDRKLAKIARASTRDWKTISATVMAFFQRTELGWQQSRLERVRAEQADKKQRLSEAGRKAGKASATQRSFNDRSTIVGEPLDDRCPIVGPIVEPSFNQSESEIEREEEPSLRDGAEAAPVDARTDLFRTGLADVRRITGMTEGRARALIGKCLKAAGDDATAVTRAIARCADARPADPVPWLLAACDAQQFRNGFLAVIAADRWGEDGPEPEEARNPFLIGSAHGTH
jgi:uncharacterized protein YdaU (DUF1376 family)